jgi:ATP/maltotriose-dependent transcriptional regulator MalT
LFDAALPLPQAVIALGELELADGDPAAAADAAERVLRRVADDSVLDRVPALELLARARAAAGDREGANAAAADVEREAERLGTPYMCGRGRLVRAEVLSAAGEPDGARQGRRGCGGSVRRVLGALRGGPRPHGAVRGARGLGRDVKAAAEARAAREAFALLGGPPAGRVADELSPRELEILRLVARGKSDAEIAEQLFLSPHTVHRHVANIRTKLRTPSRAAAVAHATRHGLL